MRFKFSASTALAVNQSRSRRAVLQSNGEQPVVQGPERLIKIGGRIRMWNMAGDVDGAKGYQQKACS
jgi:hypothetical protein